MSKNFAIIATTVMTVSMVSALQEVVKKFGEGLGNALVSGLGPNDMEKWKAAYEENSKQLPQDILKEVTETKKQFDEQQRADPEGLKKFISNPLFDEALQIVDKYDLPLPKITEPLNETVLSFYVSLVLADDERVSPMFKEMMDFSRKIPPPQ